MRYIGIDIDKKLCHACIKDRDGNIIKELNFRNESSGFDILLDYKGGEARAVIESTGNLWIRLYTSLEEAGVEVVLANLRRRKP